MMKRLINTHSKYLVRRLVNSLSVFVLFLSGLTSCTFDTNEFRPIVVPDTVSFMNDAVPILEPKCAYSGCHNSNGIPPVLKQEEAYNSLQVGYLNLSKPENSLLYRKIDRGGSMEVYASDQDRQIILTWIEQGAPNN